MAEPGSLKMGDRVTHPDWPVGTVRTACSFKPFKVSVPRQHGGGYLKNSSARIVFLDEPVSDGDEDTNLWMEAGLVLAAQPADGGK